MASRPLPPARSAKERRRTLRTQQQPAFATDAERAALRDALPGEPPSSSVPSAPAPAPAAPASALAPRQTRVVLDIANIGHHRLTHEINENPHAISFRWEASAPRGATVRTREEDRRRGGSRGTGSHAKHVGQWWWLTRPVPLVVALVK
jgi:hypothetical protein